MYAGTAYAPIRTVQPTLATGVAISVVAGASMSSAMQTGMRESGLLMQCMGKDCSNLWMDHTSKQNGLKDSPKAVTGAQLMAEQNTKGSSKACCGMALAQCIRQVLKSTWVRGMQPMQRTSSSCADSHLCSIQVLAAGADLHYHWLGVMLSACNAGRQLSSRSCQHC